MTATSTLLIRITDENPLSREYTEGSMDAVLRILAEEAQKMGWVVESSRTKTIYKETE